MKHPSGQSLAEYILPIALLVGGVFFFANNNPFQSADTISKVFSAQKGAVSGQFSMQSYGQNPNSQALSLTLANGETIMLPGTFKNIAQSVEAVGSNGTTEQLLANLDALLANPEFLKTLTPNQIQSLINLSRQGHRIGGLQKSVEDLATQFAQDKNGFGSTALSAEGTNFSSVRELTNRIAFYSSDPALSMDPGFRSYLASQGLLPQGDAMLTANGLGTELASFYTLYQAADQGGALQDPGVKSLIKSVVFEVASLSDNLENVAMGNVVLGGDPSATPDKLLSLQASSLTHVDSTTICHTGNGTDTGIKCQ